jgi:hypothetical protein
MPPSSEQWSAALSLWSTSEISVKFYQATRRKISEDRHLHARRRENPKSHKGNEVRNVLMKGSMRLGTSPKHWFSYCHFVVGLYFYFRVSVSMCSMLVYCSMYAYDDIADDRDGGFRMLPRNSCRHLASLGICAVRVVWTPASARSKYNCTCPTLTDPLFAVCLMKFVSVCKLFSKITELSRSSGTET